MKTDNNVKSLLGKRIKDRRKKLGLTQAQLCGSFMTRNMLSRIETGDASPSLDTLLFIAQKLKMPPSYFLCRDEKEEAEYTKIVKIKEARRFLATGQYKKCLDVCADLPSDDDEISFLIVNARIMNAIAAFDKGELSDSLASLEAAQTALHGTVYMYGEIRSQIKMLRLLISSLRSGTLPKTEELPSGVPSFFSRERYMYVYALTFPETPPSLFWKDFPEESPYRKHLSARLALSQGSYGAAIGLLKEAYEGASDSFAEYFILLDLEECARCCEDYKSAYEYSNEKLSMKEKFNI